MTKKEIFIGAYLDGYFSDKKFDYGYSYFEALEKVTKEANKKWKEYKWLKNISKL